MTSLSVRRCLQRNITFLKRPYEFKNYSKALAFTQNHNFANNFVVFQPKCVAVRCFATQNNEAKKCEPANSEEEEPKPGLIKRFKQMYRDYWYVLVPVHLVTSAGWFGGFYYLAKR